MLRVLREEGGEGSYVARTWYRRVDHGACAPATGEREMGAAIEPSGR